MASELNLEQSSEEVCRVRYVREAKNNKSLSKQRSLVQDRRKYYQYLNRREEGLYETPERHS